MTTNVLDKRNCKVTSDSRWSFFYGLDLVYVDDTGFDKIADRPSAVMVCAGDAKLIDAWKEWFTQPVPSNEVPPTDRIELDGSFHELYVAIVKKTTSEILFSRGDYLNHLDHASFTGTGGQYAMGCYAVNGCSIRCVETAAAHDPQTGGQIKYVDFANQASNLHPSKVRFSELEGILKKKGMVMNTVNKQTRPISGALATEIAQALAKEQVSISAPTGHPPRTWTMQEKIDVSSAMRKIVEAEAIER